jgi:phage tail protein X
LMTVTGAYLTADLLVWRRYRSPAPGILEQLLDDNPHLAKLHRVSPFLPVGTELRIPIDPEILGGRPRPVEFVTLYGRSRA